MSAWQGLQKGVLQAPRKADLGAVKNTKHERSLEMSLHGIRVVSQFARE